MKRALLIQFLAWVAIANPRVSSSEQEVWMRWRSECLEKVELNGKSYMIAPMKGNKVDYSRAQLHKVLVHYKGGCGEYEIRHGDK